MPLHRGTDERGVEDEDGVEDAKVDGIDGMLEGEQLVDKVDETKDVRVVRIPKQLDGIPDDGHGRGKQCNGV